MKRLISIFILILAFISIINAQSNSFAFQFAIGLQGSLSFLEAGIQFPVFAENLFISVKGKAMSSLTWATFIHQNGESVSFHPVVVGAVLTFGGYSPFIEDRFRMYGGMDLLLGYSFTPYDSAIYDVQNLIGDNFTFALLGHFGTEVFTAESISYYLDTGGGFKSMFCDKSNMYAIASSWLGSGFGIKNGMRFYF